MLQNGVREPLGHRPRHDSNCQLLPEMWTFHKKHPQHRNHTANAFVLWASGCPSLGNWTLTSWALQFSLHILSLPSLQSMAQLSSDFPCLSQDPDSGYLNPESWMVLPTTPEPAFLPDAVSESKFRAIPHRPHSLYPFIRQDTSELILCLGSCETCCTNCGSADSGVCTDFITHV